MNFRRLCLLAVLAATPACKKSFQPLLIEGRAHFNNQNYVEAVDSLNMALQRWGKPDGDEPKAEALQLLGQAYHRLRKVDKAIDAYQEAVRLSTATYTSAYDLGLLLLAKNEAKLASKAFQS